MPFPPGGGGAHMRLKSVSTDLESGQLVQILCCILHCTLPTQAKGGLWCAISSEGSRDMPLYSPPLKWGVKGMPLYLFSSPQVCLPSVVDVFASLANRHQVAFSYTILEQNKRLVLSSTTSSSFSLGPASHGHGTGLDGLHNNYLDCLFPFDPYQLKRCAQRCN